jgi:CheY-like chemotaxis protein
MDAGGSLTVLVVDDNPVNQQSALLMVEQLGYAVDVASSGDEAIRMVAATEYAAVLMDCQMPGTDGYQATRQIRLDHSQVRLPIIAFTADVTLANRQRCDEAGMTDFLPKPVLVADLAAMLSRWVQPATT